MLGARVWVARRGTVGVKKMVDGRVGGWHDALVETDHPPRRPHTMRSLPQREIADFAATFHLTRLEAVAVIRAVERKPEMSYKEAVRRVRELAAWNQPITSDYILNPPWC